MKQSKVISIFFFIVLLHAVSSFSQQQLSVKAFEKGIQNDVQLIDVRTKNEYDSGHIKNARLANWYDKVEFSKNTNSLNKSIPIYLYCKSGVRSGEASKLLASKGFKVFELKEGIDQWISESKKIVY
ncbi:rhodanese-related sulfurtransferase [Mariniflexile fucanivorans]|uniref:Rhodanese-related sulfurtransferase n=1 Tax=Mariniflexile fucanivorans TaxID=264023 RepID=A0A4R1RA87_9FLAO|nr:rhodanese-like domain-containing protein [Mariniflexile fucanivorans]TCL62618.1 rhodanese-related sulfurtransferase [Mariniflexile fucanivorans]